MPITEDHIKSRVAIELDIRELIEVGKEYAKEAERFSTDLVFNEDRLMQYLIAAMEDKNQQIFIATYKGKIVALMWVVITGLVWTDEPICKDLFMYVKKEFRGQGFSKELVKAVEGWAKVCGAKVMYTGANSGIQKDSAASNLYKGLGYSSGGYNFYKKL